MMKAPRSTSVPRDPSGNYSSLVRRTGSSSDAAVSCTTTFPAKSRPRQALQQPSPSVERQANQLQCLCSPTTHPGSFRCRLHRIGQPWGRWGKTWEPVPAREAVHTRSANFSHGKTYEAVPAREVLHLRSTNFLRQRAYLNSHLARKNLVMAARASSQDSWSESTKSEPNVDEGPLRFLKFAMGAGAAAAAMGVGAAAMKSFREDKSLSAFDALGPDVPPAAAAQGAGPEGDVQITVKQGDTLSALAEKTNTSIDVIKAANGLTTDVLQPGQKLWVPKTYTIQKGDTLYKIAREHETTVPAILKINTIKNPDLIYPGDVLLLP